LKAALSGMLSAPETMRKFGEAGRAWVETSGSRETMARATAVVFDETLRGKE